MRKSYWLNYHYLLPWDWKSGEFGSYDSGYGTFVLKVLYELGLIDCMRTTSSEDIRQALYKATTSKITMAQALEEIKDKAQADAIKQTLCYHH